MVTPPASPLMLTPFEIVSGNDSLRGVSKTSVPVMVIVVTPVCPETGVTFSVLPVMLSPVLGTRAVLEEVADRLKKPPALPLITFNGTLVTAPGLTGKTGDRRQCRGGSQIQIVEIEVVAVLIPQIDGGRCVARPGREFNGTLDP